MAPGSFRFDHFVLDPQDRQLRAGGEAVELNGRYLDALILLVSEQGRLVTKDRFMEEVWRGVPVTDEALTQCIRTLRRLLGDDATNPRFIETVPKHGYRFTAPVQAGGEPGAMARAPLFDWARALRSGAAGTVGGGIAGLIGGLFYGLVLTSQPSAIGAASVLLVLVCVTVLVGMVGGAGVGFGIGAAGPRWRGVLGGAVGGMVVGAVVKLVGADAFSLLLGRSPGDVTGAPEGLLLGAAVAAGVWAGALSIRRVLAAGGVAGAAAGVVIPLAGGRLMGGSLDLLAQRFPGSQLRLDQIGRLFGEDGFGLVSQVVTGGLEGLLFGACVAGAIAFARRA